MKHLKPLTSNGLNVLLLDDDHFKIQGLSSLPGDLRVRAIAYARDHKQQILFEARMQDKTIQEGGGVMFCPARCRGSGNCFGLAYFDGKPGKSQPCIPDQCLYKNQLKQYLERK